MKIELRVNGVVVYEAGDPPPGPVGPVEPPPPPPAPPSGPNPFIAWRAAGNDLVQYVMLRNGGIALTPAQMELAYAAGYPRPEATGGSTGLRAGPGFYVSYENSPRINVLNNGQGYGFTFERAGKVRVFAAAGSQLREINGQAIDDWWFEHDGSPLTITVQGVGAYGPPEVAVQLQ